MDSMIEKLKQELANQDSVVASSKSEMVIH
jgi:hypothetical protein